MAFPLRRRVSSSASSSKPQHAAEIVQLLEAIETSALDPNLAIRLQYLSLLKRVLVDSPEAKDTFRILKGFDRVIDCLNKLAGYCIGGEQRNEEDKNCFIELLKCLLGVISEALQDHIGNKRWFARKIGYDALQQGLAATGISVIARNQLFGVLLAFMMGDSSLATLLTVLSNSQPPSKDESIRHILEGISGILSSKDTIRIPEVIPIIINFQMALATDEDSRHTSAAVLQVLVLLAKSNKYNLIEMHRTGILSTILPRCWDTFLPELEREVLLELANHLIILGINNLSDAKFLYRKAMDNDSVASFLLKGIKSSRDPPHIQLDLSHHGYASIELSSLGKSFPPTSASGYTFTAWICIDKFDPKVHTTIFGIFDSTQKCFVLAYIEQDTRRFILQTSVGTPRASVRFRSITFEAGRWYHFAIAHRRGRAMSAAKAALYIDGEFIEQVKCAYPQSPSAPNHQVQLFLGTPSQLSPIMGKGSISSKWSVATAHLFEDVLSDDLIAVMYRLGLRYYGNFQDCLGSFQTYEASAALNMRNELMHPGREEKSDIISAIRHKASGVVPEHKILLSISAASVLDDNNDNNVDGTSLVKSLSKQASKSLHILVRSGAVVINGTVPSINEALVAEQGVAVMTGEPIVVVPQPLDEAAWRVAGCVSVGLKLVEMAKSPKQVCTAAEILFEMVKNSWRNSEAMEKDHGFSILANLIRNKEVKGVIGEELLKLVLEFVGFRSDCPEESIIVNPLAYRVLLVDFDMWRKADITTQKKYFAQFITFGQGSKYHHFNSKRLFRMRIVKKLLLALKGEIFSKEILPHFMAAFKALVRINMTAEVLRSLSLFITYSLHKYSSSKLLKTKKSNVHLKRQPTFEAPNMSAFKRGGEVKKDELSRQQIGTMVLEMYSELLCDEDLSQMNIKKFAKTVTNKWLLYLLADNDPKVIALATRIIARLLTVHGPNYVGKFVTKTGGFVIMRQRLKRWWNLPALWPILLSILFGMDISKIDIARPFDLFHLVETFYRDGKACVVHSEAFMVISGLLKAGVAAVMMDEGQKSTLRDSDQRFSSAKSRTRPMCFNDQSVAHENVGDLAKLLQTVIQFFEDMHRKCAGFRNFCASSDFLQDLLGILFPVVCSSDAVSAETELKARDSALTFDGGDVVIKPLSMAPHIAPPIVRAVVVDDVEANMAETPKVASLRRASSFVLVTSEPTEYSPSSARLASAFDSTIFNGKSAAVTITNAVIESLLELVEAVFVDSILERREFSGFSLFTKIPPGFKEHQVYFESYLLRNTLSHLSNTVSLNMNMLCEPRVLTNIGRFVTYMTDSIYEGWFLNGVEQMLDFVGLLLEYLQTPEIAKQKSVRLCNQTVTSLRGAMGRLVLFRLSELDNASAPEREIREFFKKMNYWQAIILSPENVDREFTRLICYLLYSRLIDDRPAIRLAAADIIRVVLVQKPDETAIILNQAKTVDHGLVASGFKKLMELDNATFLDWTDDHRKQLDAFFYGALSKSWEAFVTEQNKKIEESSKVRTAKRKEKLKQWKMEDMQNDDIYHRHESASTQWMANIYAAESVKHQRAMQDQQDNLNFLGSLWSKIDADLFRPCGLLEDGQDIKWRLDLTEGRNRMRKRMLPDAQSHLHNYQPKRRLTDGSSIGITPNLGKQHSLSVGDDEISIITTREAEAEASEPLNESPGRDGGGDDFDDDYELVEDPRGSDEDGYEDKNRKVMRSIQHGDIVEDVFNCSRLVGLSACEGLLIIGKNCLYIIDNFFQRLDGEIVNVWQAPKEERDEYLQMIAGREMEEKKTINGDHETRHWLYEELTSCSKRRFLFRDVALELFFSDGRSYLLTTMSMKDRDCIHAKLVAKSSNTSTTPLSPHMEDVWKVESLKTSDFPGSNLLGYKFANVFNPGASNPATKKWLRGEISNFHYLMLVNTMAGRTFNDLTQYPVFPWVIADYASEELDLTNPRSFRDLSKPMGGQSPEREKEFRDRYRSLQEIGDSSIIPFHYGTHYSSATTVCSFLIRLQPFVQSYLLLQGGQFDHADRLFHSVEKAWTSASKDNMADVRELIPEFFYLPEFLLNANSYNFGMKQGSEEVIDSVQLPPWAKGDPKIFIQKNREALESSYVSEHLHEWIDLVFGYKQRGDAAIEATNVFHHLSYHGAIDLDSIEDPMERRATIGIIHNFGQTPHQVFTRPHPKREELGPKSIRLDVNAESLIRLPFPLHSTGEKVASLVYSQKYEKAFYSTSFRLNVPPHYDKYMEWGFIDGSARFYHTDSKRQCGHFEHLHQGQISCAIFSDAKTLITGGTDGTISIWLLTVTPKSVDMQPKAQLFGHLAAVVVMAVSRSFSTLVSASGDNVLIWDLNRLRFVRTLGMARPVQCVSVSDVNGDILLCTGKIAQLHTLNGEHILTQNLCEAPDDQITSCAFYEGSGNEWLVRELILTGHKRGIVNIWAKKILGSKFHLQNIKTLYHTNQYQQTGVNTMQLAIPITAILPMIQAVYTGDEQGRVELKKPGAYVFEGIGYLRKPDGDAFREKWTLQS